MTVTHDFHESLAKSHAQADAPWWLEVYRRAFHNLEAAVNVREDGWAQRGGIDRVLTLRSGKTLHVDEKVRDKDWPDIALEYWSIWRGARNPSNVEGWVAKDLACDFIAYAFVPSQTCYLLPFQTLRAAWRRHCREWVAEYPRVEAKNNGYVTVSVAVPIHVLLGALKDAMIVSWGDYDSQRDAHDSYYDAIAEKRRRGLLDGTLTPADDRERRMVADAHRGVDGDGGGAE